MGGPCLRRLALWGPPHHSLCWSGGLMYSGLPGKRKHKLCPAHCACEASMSTTKKERRKEGSHAQAAWCCALLTLVPGPLPPFSWRTLQAASLLLCRRCVQVRPIHSCGPNGEWEVICCGSCSQCILLAMQPACPTTMSRSVTISRSASSASTHHGQQRCAQQACLRPVLR